VAAAAGHRIAAEQQEKPERADFQKRYRLVQGTARDILHCALMPRSVLHIDLRAENGDVCAAEEIQSGIELRNMRINFESMVHSNQLCHNRSRLLAGLK
jgi:hypothetical protein